MTADGTLYTEEDYDLHARDVRTGAEKWGGEALKGTDRVSAPRAVLEQDASLYVVDANRWTHLLDPHDGRIKRTTFPGEPLTTGSSDYAALVAGPPGTPMYRCDWRAVNALDPADGRNLWVFQGLAEQRQEQEGLTWRVASGTRIAVFCRRFSSHYFALPVG